MKNGEQTSHIFMQQAVTDATLTPSLMLTGDFTPYPIVSVMAMLRQLEGAILNSAVTFLVDGAYAFHKVSDGFH